MAACGPAWRSLSVWRSLRSSRLKIVAVTVRRTYQSADPDQSRRVLHLPGHTAGSSSLQRWSLGWNEEWFLRTHTNKWFIFAVLWSHWFYTKVINVCKNTSVRKINQVYSDSVVTLKETTFECFRINIKSSVLFSFPNTGFFDCRPVTSKQLWLWLSAYWLTHQKAPLFR